MMYGLMISFIIIAVIAIAILYATTANKLEKERKRADEAESTASMMKHRLISERDANSSLESALTKSSMENFRLKSRITMYEGETARLNESLRSANARCDERDKIIASQQMKISNLEAQMVQDAEGKGTIVE